MKSITSDYDSNTKEELLNEASSRGLDVNSHTSKADIIAALELSDEGPAQPPEPLPKIPLATPIPQVTLQEKDIPLENGGAPKDEEFTDGIFVKAEGDFSGEDFALCIHPPDTYGKTHSLKNSLHFWQGTKEEFRKTFEKK
jgi:hypothetical protein